MKKSRKQMLFPVIIYMLLPVSMIFIINRIGVAGNKHSADEHKFKITTTMGGVSIKIDNVVVPDEEKVIMSSTMRETEEESSEEQHASDEQ